MFFNPLSAPERVHTPTIVNTLCGNVDSFRRDQRVNELIMINID